MVLDGSPNGWTFKIADNSGFAQIVDPTGFFQGGDRCDVLDTYLLWNIIGTRQFGSTLSGTLTFDPLYFGAKSAYPDPLQTLVVNRREIILLGLVKSELWYDAGNPQLPFAELPGAYIEHGIAGKYSIASNDISVFWLGKDLQNGVHYVFRQRGYETRVISNPAISYAIRKMIAAGYDLTATVGWCFSQDGHTFYMLQFPQQGSDVAPIGDQTWVFDDSIEDVMRAWHQEAWTDADGLLHRHRGNCYASLYGKNVCGDWANGQLYEMDPDYYYDQVNAGAGILQGAISFIRGFPHLMAAIDNSTQQFLPSNGTAITHEAFWVAMECGTDPTQDVNTIAVGTFVPQLTVRWSDDWGASWKEPVQLSAGALGEFGTTPQLPTLGVARYRLYELSHSIPGPAALLGAWVRGRLNEMNR